MTNLRKNFGLMLLLAAVIVLSGCKKDDESTAQFFLDKTSLGFEYGQAKEVAYTSHKIAKFNDDKMEIPEGWTCTRTGEVFKITAPSQGNPDAASGGTIKVSVETESGIAITRSLKVSAKITEEITQVANSFIVSEPGHRYKFNARRRGNESTASLTGTTNATLVWTTSKTAILNISYEDGYIYFATGDADELEEANALVAVTDDDGNVLWSWHIWATVYDPTTEFDLYGGEKVMNRNLGAFRNSNDTARDACLSYGLYYQWGRKDPFVGPDAWDSNTQQPIYSAAGIETVHLYEKSTEEVGTIEYSIAHPKTFIAGFENNDFNWLNFSDSGLWAAPVTGAKTIYDPCPDGWRVAGREVYDATLKPDATSLDPDQYNIVGGYNYGWTFDIEGQEIFFPAAGRRSFSPSLATSTRNFTNVVNDGGGVGYPVGFYWSSKPYAISSLAFSRDYIKTPNVVPKTAEEDSAAGGFPLRCVAE